MKFLLLSLIFIIINQNSWAQSGPIWPNLAQSGPTVPCVDCENYTQRTLPLNGLWYNPEQSGVGISIEVQKNLLFGVYYGYDESGDSTWFTFLGELVKSDDPEIMWTVDVNLTEFENGTCQNCTYQAPNHTDFASTMQIKFRQKNHASFSINNEEEQFIVPLVFSTPQSIDFPMVTSFPLPNPDIFDGTWVYTYRLSSGGIGPTQMIQHSSKIDVPHDDGTSEIIYILYEIQWPEALNTGRIVCKTSLDEQDNITDPTCTFQNFLFDLTPEVFKFTLAGIGADRIYGESDAGHTLEGIRLDRNHDHPDN